MRCPLGADADRLGRALLWYCSSVGGRVTDSGSISRHRRSLVGVGHVLLDRRQVDVDGFRLTLSAASEELKWLYQR